MISARRRRGKFLIQLQLSNGGMRRKRILKETKYGVRVQVSKYVYRSGVRAAASNLRVT